MNCSLPVGVVAEKMQKTFSKTFSLWIHRGSRAAIPRVRSNSLKWPAQADGSNISMSLARCPVAVELLISPSESPAYAAYSLSVRSIVAL